MQIRQISIFLQNKPGQLSQICRDLADADINIATLSLADTSDFGIVRMIVDDHEKANDRPGGMAEVMATLDKAGANIEYSYAFAFHKGEKAVLVFRFDDNAKAAQALAAAGFLTLSEEEAIGAMG